MTGKLFRGLFLGAVLGALLFRVAGLDLRPMHHDEANQALKFGELLERGHYRYDPRDHHGPSLYYLTLPAAGVAGERSLAELRETTLRLVPALFGAGIVALLLLFAGGLSRQAALSAAALIAVSPAMTYYSRFYIQETLLVFFLAGLVAAGWRYARTRSAFWALAAGFCAGMMMATKETCLILFGAMAAALGISRLLASFERSVWPAAGAPGRPPLLHALLFLAAAAAAAVALLTSFFSHPAGPADAVRAVGTYLGRAGESGIHVHPWSYYLGMLAYSRFGQGPVWSEGLVLVLAVVGGLAALRRDQNRDGPPQFPRFVLFFTLICAAVYSAIPYKTPWNVLPFYWGLLLLAGHGAGFLLGLKFSRFRLGRSGLAVLLAAGFLHLAWQGYRANFVGHSDPSNPYVYAQTSPDLLKLVEQVEEAAAGSPEGAAMLIKIVAPPDETWPLPWYLRRFTRVGYWTDVEEAGELGEADAVIASAAFADTVGERLGNGFRLSYFGLRPEVVLALFVKRPLTAPAVPF
ncbi:MAG: TIGR03663 family protein [Candidatus Aminicenantes bacterium]|nr:TIGR03663 family protein [Candidatus Aminicenantes bacterium]